MKERVGLWAGDIPARNPCFERSLDNSINAILRTGAAAINWCDAVSRRLIVRNPAMRPRYGLENSPIYQSRRAERLRNKHEKASSPT